MAYAMFSKVLSYVKRVDTIMKLPWYSQPEKKNKEDQEGELS